MNERHTPTETHVAYLERQPDFPKTDLLEQNADFMRTFLTRPNLSFTGSPENPDGHLEEYLARFDLASSESNLEIAHKIYTASTNIERYSKEFSSVDEHFGFTYGYSTYELMSSLVAPKEFLAKSIPAMIATKSLSEAMRTKSIDDFLHESRDKIITEQPCATDIIGESTARLYPDAADNAILGAAVRRQLELDSLEYSDNLVQ